MPEVAQITHETLPASGLGILRHLLVDLQAVLLREPVKPAVPALRVAADDGGLND